MPGPSLLIESTDSKSQEQDPSREERYSLRNSVWWMWSVVKQAGHWRNRSLNIGKKGIVQWMLSVVKQAGHRRYGTLNTNKHAEEWDHSTRQEVGPCHQLGGSQHQDFRYRLLEEKGTASHLHPKATQLMNFRLRTDPEQTLAASVEILLADNV